MAMPGPEVELLTAGMDAGGVEKGAHYLNLVRLQGEWHTRKGFGQVSHFDSGFANGNVEITHHLGSTIMKTDFGHEQVVSVSRAKVWTGSLQHPIGNGQYATVYLATIYDTTTDQWWEEMLHPRTGEQRTNNSLRHALYETDRDTDCEQYLHAADAEFFFEEVQDILYFGSRRAGMWAYIPCSPMAHRPRYINATEHRPWHMEPYGESSVFLKVSPQDGLYADTFAYLNEAEFPRPADVSALLDRMVYADDTIIYFSDPYRPTCIVADNYRQVPSENPIRAITELNGNLLLWTASEMFLYQPPATGLVLSGGRLTKLSDTIGCCGPSAVTRAAGFVFWADDNGVYVTTTGLDTKPIDDGIAKLWRSDGGISNPLTTFFQDSGNNTLANDQPGILKRWSSQRVNLQYDHIREALLLTLPERNVTFVWQGAWHVWGYASMAAATGAANTTRTENIVQPWPLMGERELYMVCSDEATVTDDTLSPTAYTTPSGEAPEVGSLCVLRYGHGGSTDRSVQSIAEDRRALSARYYSTASYLTPTGLNAIHIRPWIKVPPSHTLPGGTAASGTTYLLPIEVSPDDNLVSLPDQLDIRFRFDNTKWTPLLRSGAEIDYVLPVERVASAAGYDPMTPGTRGVHLYDNATGAPSAAGDEVRILFEGNVGAYTAMYAPYMNLLANRRNRLIYIPFRYTGSEPSTVTQMGIYVTSATITRTGGGGFALNCIAYVWQQAGWAAERNPQTDPEQPVDWCFMSAPVDGKSKTLKARGLYIRGASRGAADDPIFDTSAHGLLNVLFGSDYKGWVSQIVDHAGNLAKHGSIETLRARLKNTSGAMVKQVFEGGDAVWGSALASAAGNTLIADEPVDELSVSDSVKGNTLRYMLFGHVRSRGEKLMLRSVMAVVRAAGNRRRKGR